MMKLSPLVVCVIAVVAPLIAAQTVRTIDGQLLELNVCYSTTSNLRVASVSLTQPPIDRVTLITNLDVAPKITINCASFIQTANNAQAPTTDPACSTPNSIFLCSSPTTEDTWTCEELPEYVYANVVEVSRGSTNGPAFKWQIRIRVGARATFCFPRDIQLVAVVSTEQAIKGNVVLLVFVGILLGLVAICVIAFALFALRKHAAKMQREGDPLSFGVAYQAPVDTTNGNPSAQFPLPTVDGEYAPQPLPIAEVRTLYLQSPAAGNYVLGTDGIPSKAYAPEDRFDEHLRQSSRGLGAMERRQSLYQRSFQGSLDTGANVDIHVWSPTDHPDSLAIPTAIPIEVLERVERSPRKYNPLHEGSGGGGGGVNVCADCHVVVQDQAAPKLCPVSGKRHY